MNITGLDLSLTATGISCADHTDTLKPPSGMLGVRRLDWYRREIVEHIAFPVPMLVVIEGYSYNSRVGGERLGELGGVIRLLLYTYDCGFVEIPPATLKKFATGKGNCGKDEMVAAAVRHGCPASENNSVDAWWLRQLGLYATGAPVVPVTAYRNAVVNNLDWPEKGNAA